MRTVELVVLGVLAGGALLLLANPKKTGQLVVSTGVDLADGIVSRVVVGAGQLVGIPDTDSAKAAAAMDEFAAAPWYDKALLSFKVASYASAADYLRWVADSRYRPLSGSY